MRNDHQGKIIHKIIKKKNISITQLSKQLEVSRTTIYNKLASKKIEDLFIIALGDAMNHDFSSSFPHLKAYYQKEQDEIERQCYLNNLMHNLENLTTKYKKVIKMKSDLLNLFITLVHDSEQSSRN